MRSKRHTKKPGCYLAMALLTGIFMGCTPDEEEYALGAISDAAFTVTDISTKEMKNTFLLESTTENAFLHQWDLGNGSEPFVGGKVDTAYFENKGSYTITLTAVSQGGSTTASMEVNVEEDAVTGTNAVLNGGLDSGENWNFIGTGSAETTFTLEEGALTFTNTAPAQTNIVMWQEVKLKGGRAYQFDADVKGGGMFNSWLEVILLDEIPQEGTDPSGAFMGLNTWTGCGADPFDQPLSSLSCLGDGKKTIAEDGTYYLVIKAGSWDGHLGPGGITIDNIQFIAGPRLTEGENILTGGSMDDESLWTTTNMGMDLTTVDFADGVLKFTNGPGAVKTNAGVWQAIGIAAGQVYKLKATIHDPGATGSWIEFYLSATAPVDGADYTTGRITPGDTRSFPASGTVYLLIKVGSWDGNLGSGVTIDNVELIEMN